LLLGKRSPFVLAALPAGDLPHPFRNKIYRRSRTGLDA
jgi:hypothetical protein